MNSIEITYINGPKVEVIGTEYPNLEYDVQFIDTSNNAIIHTAIIKNNMWTKALREWYVPWRIQVRNRINGAILKDELFDVTGKRVHIKFDSSSLGDTLAWIPYVEEFRHKHKCIVVCSTFWNRILQAVYPEILFIPPEMVPTNIYAVFELGWFWNPNKNPIDVRLIPLQKTATDILGLSYHEIRPKVVMDKPAKYSGANPHGKYICIATQSTAQPKYWNNPGAWEAVVDHFLRKGYEVYCIDKEFAYGQAGKKPNYIPRNAISDAGNKPIEDRIWLLKGADLFIGLGSGLSWLAWACNTPVVMISGFSKPYAEFTTGINRIENADVCNGCFNDLTHQFDRSDWNWCPRHKFFECSRSITAKQVIDASMEMLKIQ